MTVISQLYIAEKPKLAQVIVDNSAMKFTKKQGHYTSSDGSVVVTWAYGHMISIAEPHKFDPEYAKWNLTDLPLKLSPTKYEEIAKSRDQARVIKGLLKQTETVVHAGDPDDEGQLLIDELIKFYSFKGDVKRVLISSTTGKSVGKALANLEPNSKYEHLGRKAKARSEADFNLGMNLTRLYTLKAQQKGFQGVISVGRVQSAVLGLVVRRDADIAAHKSENFYKIEGLFVDKKTNMVKAVYQPRENLTLDQSGRLSDKEQAIMLAGSFAGQSFLVSKKTEAKKAVLAPLPFSLVKLQQHCSKVHGLTADQVLKITQSLREKYDLITYNRSDCQYINEDQHKDAPEILAAIAANFNNALLNNLQGCDSNKKGRAFNSEKVTAHDAIIPTEAKCDVSRLSKDERLVYAAICERYAIQFAEDRIVLESFAEFSGNIGGNTETFTSRAKRVLSLGWSQHSGAAQSEDDEDEDDAPGLEQIEQGALIKCSSCEAVEKKTEPKKPYTESTLLGDMTSAAKYILNPKLKKVLIERDKDKEGESGGIGTPATRHTILETLLNRGFIVRKGKQIRSTKTGQELNGVLSATLSYPDLTAIWTEKLKTVDTDADIDAFVGYVLSAQILPEIERIKTNGVAVTVQAAKTCDKCGRPMRKFVAKKTKTPFWSCTGYSAEPPCDNTESIVTTPKKTNTKKTEAAKSATPTDFKCGVCSKPLIKRPSNSPSGSDWFGCSGFPSCKKTYSSGKDGEPNFT